MARTPIIAGNWKMNMLSTTAVELVRAIVEGVDGIDGVETIVCPPAPYLPFVLEAVQGSAVRVGAQNIHWEEVGAFTGEMSAPMVREFATHTIIGHSERRAYFAETDATVNLKLKAALTAGLVPIVCVGETGAERTAGQTLDVLRRQVRGALEGVTLPLSAVIAYEPVWAIGTGVAATVQDAQEATAFIRSEIASLQGEQVADAVRILYGGSVSPSNAADLIAQPDVDGGLVGGASLVAASFVEIVRGVAG